MKEKKSVSITITDVDDFEKVCDSLDNLFRTILLHYADTNMDKANFLIISCAYYFNEMANLLFGTDGKAKK